MSFSSSSSDYNDSNGSLGFEDWQASQWILAGASPDSIVVTKPKSSSENSASIIKTSINSESDKENTKSKANLNGSSSASSKKSEENQDIPKEEEEPFCPNKCCRYFCSCYCFCYLCCCCLISYLLCQFGLCPSYLDLKHNCGSSCLLHADTSGDPHLLDLKAAQTTGSETTATVPTANLIAALQVNVASHQTGTALRYTEEFIEASNQQLSSQSARVFFLGDSILDGSCKLVHDPNVSDQMIRISDFMKYPTTTETTKTTGKKKKKFKRVAGFNSEFVRRPLPGFQIQVKIDGSTDTDGSVPERAADVEALLGQKALAWQVTDLAYFLSLKLQARGGEIPGLPKSVINLAKCGSLLWQWGLTSENRHETVMEELLKRDYSKEWEKELSQQSNSSSSFLETTSAVSKASAKPLNGSSAVTSEISGDKNTNSTKPGPNASSDFELDPAGMQHWSSDSDSTSTNLSQHRIRGAVFGHGLPAIITHFENRTDTFTKHFRPEKDVIVLHLGANDFARQKGWTARLQAIAVPGVSDIPGKVAARTEILEEVSEYYRVHFKQLFEKRLGIGKNLSLKKAKIILLTPILTGSQGMAESIANSKALMHFLRSAWVKGVKAALIEDLKFEDKTDISQGPASAPSGSNSNHNCCCQADSACSQFCSLRSCSRICQCCTSCSASIHILNIPITWYDLHRPNIVVGDKIHPSREGMEYIARWLGRVVEAVVKGENPHLVEDKPDNIEVLVEKEKEVLERGKELMESSTSKK